MTDLSWLKPRDDQSGCVHDYSHKVEIDRADLPKYVTGPAYNVYCIHCGTQQSLRERVAENLTELETEKPL